MEHSPAEFASVALSQALLDLLEAGERRTLDDAEESLIRAGLFWSRVEYRRIQREREREE